MADISLNVLTYSAATEQYQHSPEAMVSDTF